MRVLNQEPRWLTREHIERLQAESVQEFGGLQGIRDEGLLESALGRPQNHYAYGSAVTLPRLAAAYGFGLIKNHPFLDGNKRVGLLAVRWFMRANGYRVEADPDDLYATVIAVASGTMDEDALAEWIDRVSVAD